MLQFFKRINDPFIIGRITICCFVILILGSCESHMQKDDDTFDLVKDMGINDTITELVTINENLDEWAKFRIEIGMKIFSNGITINDIKSNPKASANLIRKVVSLEEDNNRLRKQMEEYINEMKVKSENFKVLMNHNVNTIRTDLKDLSIYNMNSE